MDIKKILKNKKALIFALSFVLVSSVAVGTSVGCKPKDPGSSEVESSIVDTKYDGNYYLDAVDGEYSLSLVEGTFELTIGGKTQSGTFDFVGKDLQFVFSDNTLATAKVVNGNIQLSYNQTTYNFWKKVEYSVSYSVEGTVSSTVNVLNGKTAAKPVDPVKEGWVFAGWYLDEAYTNPFDFEGTLIHENTTLYARFVEKTVGIDEFKATLVVDGEVYAEQETTNGVLYVLPSVPAKDGAVFAGWWMSDDEDATKLTCQYTDQVLKEHTTLYAVWKTGAPLVSVSENLIKWTPTSAGANYTVSVYVDGTQIKKQKTMSVEYEFDFTTRGPVSYVVEVSDGTNTSTAYYNYNELDRVSIFKVEDPSLLVFNAVENAEKYLITVSCGNESHTHVEYDNGTSTYFNFANCEMKKGGITFTVTAVAEGYTSSVSKTFTYERNLDELTGLNFNEETYALEWNAVENASSYLVEVTQDGATKSYTVNGNTFALKSFTGELGFKVTAVARGYNSSSATYECSLTKLPAPTDVMVIYNLIKWTAVDGATGYVVKIDGVVVGETEENSFEIPAANQVPGMVYDVTVQAVAADSTKNSLESDPITVKYAEVDIKYENGALRWAAVGGAASYEYAVNDLNSTTLPAGSMNTTITFTKAGENVIVFRAKDADGKLLGEKEVVVTAHELVFDSCSSMGQTSQYLAVGDTINYPEVSYEGYTFAGWYLLPGGASVNAGRFDDAVYSDATLTTLYAYWESNEYEVTLMVNGEVYATEIVKYNKDYSLSTPQAPVSGDTFVGWFAEDGSNGYQFTDESGDSKTVWDYVGGRTLYAGWTTALQAHMTKAANGEDAVSISKADGEGFKTLKEITVPATFTIDGVTYPVVSIVAEAFANCKNLEIINIPNTIETIFIGEGGVNATGSSFYGCEKLKYINVYEVEGNHEVYFKDEDGVLIRQAQPNVPMEHGVELYYFPAGRSGVYTVPSGVEYIPQKTFQNAKITDLIIPETVAMIGKQAFEKSSITSVVFSEAESGNAKPLQLSKSAFAYCYALTSVDFPARLVETDFAEMNVFDSCTKLSAINVLGEGGAYTSNDGILCDASGREIIYCPIGRTGEVKIPVAIQGIADGAFKGCSKITSVIVGGNVATIGAEAFMGCRAVTTVEFRGTSGTLEIGEKAFYGCTMLRELELSTNVTKIGAKAFGDTTSNTKVVLNGGANVEYAEGAFMNDDGVGYVTDVVIGKNMGAFEIKGVFAGCSIQSVSVAEGNTNYWADENGVLYNSDKTMLVFFPKKQIAEYVLPNTVTHISAGVFEGNADFTTFTIGKNVVSIGANAFKGMPNLATVIFEPGRTEPLTIGDNAFEGNTQLVTIELPETLKSIGAYAFKGCTSLTTLTLPSSLETLGNAENSGVFDDCTKLESIQIATAGNDNFYSDNGILYGKTEGVVTDLYFVPASATGAVVIPKTVRTIPEKAFYGHAGITSISFEDNTAPADLRIGDYAFAKMSALTSATLPSGLTVIPYSAFAESSKLASLNVPNTVNYIELRAFFNTTSLKTLTFEAGNEDNTLVFEDGNWTTTNISQTEGVLYGAPLTEFKLPERVRMIPDYYFMKASFVKVVIPASMERIGVNAFNSITTMTTLEFAKREDGTRANLTLAAAAFKGCTVLNNLVVPSSIVRYEGEEYVNNAPAVGVSGTDTYISKYATNAAFRGCTGLKNLSFEDGLKVIGSGMFYGCTNLANDAAIVIPDSVTTIGNMAFAKSYLKKGITLGAGVKTIGDYAFENCQQSATAGLPSIVIPASVETIGVCAFNTCKALATVSFAETGAKLKSIGTFAFNACTKLTTVTLPYNEEVTELHLGTSVFKGCTAIKTANIPSNVLKLNGAFAGCGSTLKVSYAGQTNVEDANGFVTTDSGKRLVAYNGTATEVVIPAGVETIGENVFVGKTTITKVTLPSTLKVIEWYAFQNCSALTTVEIDGESRLTVVGTEAFSGTALEAIDLSTVVELGDKAFYNCKALTKVVLNDNLTAIGASAFENCTALTAITLPSSLKTLGKGAFKASGLTSIVLPEALVCDNLGAGYWFANCESLTSVTINSTNLGILPDSAFSYCTALESIVIPEGVTTIGDAFYCASGLKNITFPTTLTTIDSTENYGSAFYQTAIETLDFSMTSLATLSGPYLSWGAGNTLTFTGMDALKTLIFPATLTSLDSGHINKSNNIETFIAPGLTVVYNSLLADRTKLTTVELSPELTVIDNHAFYGCSSLTSFNFPDSVTTIGKSAFYGTGLSSLDFGSNLVTIGAYAFANTQVVDVSIPASLTEIGAFAFAGCSNLVGFTVSASNMRYYAGDYKELYDNTDALVVFPAALSADNGVFTMKSGTKLSTYAFAGVLNLTEVVLPNDLYEIPEGAFAESSISTITIPDTVSVIGALAFADCEKLATLTIPASVTSLGEEFFYGPVEVDSANTVYKNGPYGGVCTLDGTLVMLPKGAGVDGVLEFEAGIKFAAGAFYENMDIVEVILPSDLKEIPSAMFQYSSIKRLTIPASVTTISWDAFKGSSLEELTFADRTTVLAIPSKAFQKYTNLKSVTIGANVTLGTYAFDQCTALTTVVLPDTLTTIPDYAFQKCSKLTSVTIGSNVTSIGKYAFKECKALTSITIPASVTTIGQYAFQTCSALTEVLGMTGVKTIDNYAFASCTALTTITLPETLTSINTYAFQKCTAMTEIIIPVSVTSIKANAFNGWTAAQTIKFAGRADATGITFGHATNWKGSANVVYLGKSE